MDRFCKGRGIFIVDTETTGLPRHGKVYLPGGRGWPHLVQVAWILYDGSGCECKRENLLIKPAGFDIPESAVAIHGITTEQALRDGVVLRDALRAFARDMLQAVVVVAHNMRFDQGVIAAECFREGLPDPFVGRRNVCTMLASSCRAGRNQRLLSLGGLYRDLFLCEHEGAHDAANDAEACALCFFEMVRRGDIRM